MWPLRQSIVDHFIYTCILFLLSFGNLLKSFFFAGLMTNNYGSFVAVFPFAIRFCVSIGKVLWLQFHCSGVYVCWFSLISRCFCFIGWCGVISCCRLHDHSAHASMFTMNWWRGLGQRTHVTGIMHNDKKNGKKSLSILCIDSWVHYNEHWTMNISNNNLIQFDWYWFFGAFYRTKQGVDEWRQCPFKICYATTGSNGRTVSAFF